jgi:twitching motility protein PilT
MDKFESLISSALSLGVSDIHVTVNHPVVYRINGSLKFQTNLKLSHEEVDALAEALLTPVQINQLQERYSVDCASSLQMVRLRINFFNTTRGLSLAIRILPGSIPTVEQLNLHPSLKGIGKLTSGLILICGSTGVGKTTTIAAIIDEINRNCAHHIITLEDPIEYRIFSKKSLVEQRELGTHMPSFYQGLLDVLREDPDVIVVGEMRDPETIKLTLNIAESGHLIIATLHASNTEEALHRILNAFPLESQDDIRHRLASTLSWLVIQKLVLLEKYGFRVPHLSILLGNQAAKGTIRENKLHQIENVLQLGKSDGMFTFDRYLSDYLLNLKNPVPPGKSFLPSLEMTDEIVYRSAIMGNFRKSPKKMSKNKEMIAPPTLPSMVGDQSEDQSEDQSAVFSPTGKSLKDFIVDLDKKFK